MSALMSTATLYGGTQGASVYNPIDFEQCPMCGTWKQAYKQSLASKTIELQNSLTRQYSSQLYELQTYYRNLYNQTQLVNRRGYVEVKEKKNMIKYKKYEDKGFTRSMVNEVLDDVSLFREDDYDGKLKCVKHHSVNCETCLDGGLSSLRNAQLPALLATPAQYKSVDKNEFVENFESQVAFIQKGLDMKDEDVKKLKVVDLAGKLAEAQQKITVGNMRDLMKERLRPWGFLETLIRKLSRASED